MGGEQRERPGREDRPGERTGSPPGELHGWISTLAVGGGSVWASVVPDDVVFRLSADDASVEETDAAGEAPASLPPATARSGSPTRAGRALTRIDVRRAGAPSRSTGLPRSSATAAALLWAAAAPAPAPAPPAEDRQIRVALRDSGIDLDPATARIRRDQLLYSTCANLVSYPDAEGPAGRVLRPDAAVALPQVSADRRNYTFRIRARPALLAAVGAAARREGLQAHPRAHAVAEGGARPAGLTRSATWSVRRRSTPAALVM